MNVNDEKMSKSLGNFTTVHDMLAHYDDPMVIRYLLATTQYRRPINYTPDTLEQARAELERIRTAYRNVFFRIRTAKTGHDDSVDYAIAEHISHFREAMDDDFNTQNAIASIFELVTIANNYASRDEIKLDTATRLTHAIADLMNVFGINGLSEHLTLSAEAQALLDKRVQARAVRDFNLSDQLRDQLSDMGIIVEDTTQGQRWHHA